MEVGGGVVLGLSVDMKLSKAELLREIVCEKLTTAAREIFAVVERTVSGYEEEAAALRREVERQKEQLEAVLQPRVTLRRIDWEDSATWAGSEDDEVEDVEDKEPEKKEGGAIKLQVCLLQDAHADMLTRNVFKSSVQEVMCPPDLKEAEFLDLLRSTFPQLSAEFEAFTVDVTQKLTPLNLETVTPENMEAAIKSRGNGPSALYVRVKEVEESQRRPEQPPSSETNHRTKDDATNDHEGARASFSSVPVQRAESRQHQTKPNEVVEHGGISEDFTAPDSAHCAADSDDGDDAEDGIDDRDEEWKPDEKDKEIKSRKRKHIPPKTKKKKMNSVVKRKRKNLEASTENVLLSCKVCQALSGSRNMLIKHSWSHVEDPERLCGVCGEHSESSEELRSHLNSHKKTYSCDVCGKNFISRIGLKRHAVLHTGEKPYRCDDCDKTFTCISNLKKHRWEHVERKPYKCDVCDRTFAWKQLATAHHRSHTGEKPYTCNECGKSFRNLRALSQHTPSHSGKRRYSCSICGKRFLIPLRLKQHERIHSERVKTFLCDVCCKAFHTLQELNVHLRTHSQEKVTCGVCGKELSSTASLKKHLGVHTEERPYECSVCGKNFKYPNGLRVHMMLHSGVKEFVCSVCGKACSRKEYLKVHMRTHNGEKPYKCNICDKGFTQSHCLKTHMKTHHREEEDG